MLGYGDGTPETESPESTPSPRVTTPRVTTPLAQIIEKERKNALASQNDVDKQSWVTVCQNVTVYQNAPLLIVVVNRDSGDDDYNIVAADEINNDNSG